MAVAPSPKSHAQDVGEPVEVSVGVPVGVSVPVPVVGLDGSVSGFVVASVVASVVGSVVASVDGSVSEAVTEPVGSAVGSAVPVPGVPGSFIAATDAATSAGSRIRQAPKRPACTRSDGQPTLRLISS